MIIGNLLHQPLPYDAVLVMISSRGSQLTAELINDMKDLEILHEDEIEND